MMDANAICAAVCAFHQTDLALLTSPSRAAPVVWVRHELMYVLHNLAGVTQSSIGALLGGRDHQTVSTGIRRVSKRMTLDGEYARHIVDLIAYVRDCETRPMLVPALARARRIVAAKGYEPEDVTQCGLALLSAASVLASAELTDAEARRAALQILGGPNG